MDARPYLVEMAKLFRQHNLEAVLLGNAGAAVQGVPITTVDFDFMFRKTPVNVRKLKRIADALGAIIYRPYYPVSSLYRMVRERDQFQIDFMVVAHGVRSFEGLRARASRVEFDGASLLVASLDDIIKSKEAAARPRDLAALPILKDAANEKKADKSEREARSDGQGP
jgi:hypothetical protein